MELEGHILLKVTRGENYHMATNHLILLLLLPSKIA
jgi:hypothetical protein